MIKKIWSKILQHKILSVFLAVIILGGSYYAYGKLNSSSAGTQYVLATVEKGTLVSSVSGSGQVSALNQVDIKPKASGDIIYVGVKNGQWVNAGTLIAKIDDSDAQKAIRDAQANLESAKLSFEKLKQSTADTAKLHEDAFNAVSNAFIDLPNIISGAQTIILGTTLSSANNQSNKGVYIGFFLPQDQDNATAFANIAENDYTTARAHYDATLLLYENTSRSANPSDVEKLLSNTIETTRSIAQALKSEQNLLRLVNDYASSHQKSVLALITTYLSNLNTYASQNNSYISNLINSQNDILNAPLDIASQELSIKQKEIALSDTEEKVGNYYIRAPFSGLIGQLNVKAYDSVSAGTAVAVLITKQKVAEISLNEVDVSKVKTGQKATLTFDAISDLNITGEVSEIDSIGTVSQGVVTYNVQIAFDTQDDRVKSGMSVSAAIITGTKQDILLVPNAAVKSQGGAYYVEVQDATTPIRQPVEIGISNDTMTEIISGLKEGDSIITRTVTSAATTQTQSGSSFRIPGLR